MSQAGARIVQVTRGRATRGGNQSFATARPFDPATSDLLYVLTDAGARYLIPTKVVSSRRQLNLGRNVERYLI